MPDQDPYWAGFETEVYFDEPGDQIVGVVEQRVEDKGARGKVPRLGIRTEDGALRWVTAWQARLLTELADLKPLIGERLWILYIGDDAQAAPGMNPAKRFKVKVDRDNPPPQDQAGPASGEVHESDKGPVAGSKPEDKA